MAKDHARNAAQFFQDEKLELLTYQDIADRWGYGEDTVNDLAEAGLTVITATDGQSAKKAVFKDHFFSILRQKAISEGQQNVYDPEKFKAARAKRRRKPKGGK